MYIHKTGFRGRFQGLFSVVIDGLHTYLFENLLKSEITSKSKSETEVGRSTPESVIPCLCTNGITRADFKDLRS